MSNLHAVILQSVIQAHKTGIFCMSKLKTAAMQPQVLKKVDRSSSDRIGFIKLSGLAPL